MSDCLRTYIDLPPEMVEELALFQKHERIRNRAEAIRRLMQNSFRNWQRQRKEEGVL